MGCVGQRKGHNTCRNGRCNTCMVGTSCYCLYPELLCWYITFHYPTSIYWMHSRSVWGYSRRWRLQDFIQITLCRLLLSREESGGQYFFLFFFLFLACILSFPKAILLGYTAWREMRKKKSFQIILREGNKLGFSTNISFKDDSGTISWIKECYFSAQDHQHNSLGLKINCVLRLHLESDKFPDR